MSSLWDKLNKIAREAEESPAPEQAVQERKPCACLREERSVMPLTLTREGLATLCGDDEAAALFAEPESLAFLDTETTGLSGAGTIAFEIGLGLLRDGKMQIHQFWIRDYDEEEDMLTRLNALMQGVKGLVTFNGKGYDVPLLQSRLLLSRIHAPWTSVPNIDLLHAARRLYKLRLKDCSLSNLEECVLGVHRQGDIPGAEIPQLWFTFLKEHDEAPLKPIFTHNAQDVFSMALLLQKMHDAHAAPLEQTNEEDIFSLGRIFEKQGRVTQAEQCFIKLNTTRLRARSGQALNRIYRRTGRVSERERVLLNMASAGISPVFTHTELAKIAEHTHKEPVLALQHTDTALSFALDPEEIAALRHRRARLLRRIEKTHGIAPKGGE